MFIALYTLQIVYICVVMMCSTSYCLWHTYGPIEYVCVCACASMHACVCMYVCMQVCMSEHINVLVGKG
jgi:hypothetical protein